MSYIIIFVLTIMIKTLSTFSNSQNCIPIAIIFTTQAQVEYFSTNYPGCTTVDGNNGITGDIITNLDRLIQITQIKESITNIKHILLK